MSFPTLVVEYSTDDANDPTPTWTTVDPDKIASVSTQRGVEAEDDVVGPGTATIVLEDEDREIDPAVNPLIDVMNRWRVRAVINDGLASEVTEDVIVGYAESYLRQVRLGVPYVTGKIVDEFKVLALDELPATNPPLGSYQEVVQFDSPSAYYPLTYPNWSSGLVGGDALVSDGIGAGFVNGVGAVVGEPDPACAYHFGTGYFVTNPLVFGSALDITALEEFTIEALIAVSNTPSGTETLLRGPKGVPSTDDTWRLSLNTSRQLVLKARNGAGTDHTITSTTALTTSATIGADTVWYHVVGTITDGSLRLYVNGTEEASTAWTGPFGQIESDGSEAKFIIGNEGSDIGVGELRMFDEVAFYKVGLDADRVLAHYNAARLRGFPRGQDPGDRVEAVLDESTSVAPRNVRTGTRGMNGSYMIGQAPLDELRKAEQAENVDALLFIARDGTITFLDAAHRDVSPWNTVQATFSDDPASWDDGALPYEAVTLDFSDSFLTNSWSGTREGGTTYTATDATSVSRRLRRPKSLTGLPLTSQSDVEDIVDDMLAKYKDPMTRITGLDLVLVDEVAETALALEIGDRIRVIARPDGTDLYGSGDYGEGPYSGSIDQTLFIQGIAVEVSKTVWTMRLSVSPL